MSASGTPQDPAPGATSSGSTPALAIDPRRSMIRAVAWVLGVLFLQFAFIYSYVAAFHDPTPPQLEVQVVAPEFGGSQAQELVEPTLSAVPSLSPPER